MCFGQTLLAGSKVNLVGRVEVAVGSLLTGAGIGGTDTASTGGTGRANVLGRSALASAFTGRTSTA